MPELPEVETVVRSIRPLITGRMIERAELLSHRVTRQDHAATAAGLAGCAVEEVRRRGKQILIDLDRNGKAAGILYVHLGMTGKLLWSEDEGAFRPKHTRAVLYFADGTLFYDDPRMFGRVEFYPAIPAILTSVGPDARAVPLELFKERLTKHRGSIKTVLLNQRFLAGVGNIYADEALFAAAIHPRAVVGRLSAARRARLHTHLVEILETAIAHKGSSISDYVDGEGGRGWYQQSHNVYGRAGEPCPRCGNPIRRIVLGQRGTHYCPRCQRP